MQDIEEQCSIPEPAPKPHVPWQQSKGVSKLEQSQQHWKSLIVLIPLRLGTEKLNPVYAHCLKLLLSTEHCLGIIGGKPKHSLYFVGFQEDKLIHLDPHYCQEMVDVNQETFSMHSFHCKSPRKLKSSKMDPSCCIGFYCATKTDFDSFVESVQLVSISFDISNLMIKPFIYCIPHSICIQCVVLLARQWKNPQCHSNNNKRNNRTVWK